MRKLVPPVLAIVALLSTNPVGAAVISLTFGPGELGTGNCLPFGCIPDLRYQQVYSASEFSGRINIKELTFYNELYSVGSIDPAHYAILLSVTDKAPNALDLTDLDNNIGDDQRLFFDGDLSGSLSSTHRLTISGHPYNYDPDDGNLLLEIIKTDGGPDYGTVFLDRFTNDPSIGSSRAFEYGGVIGDPAESHVGLVTTFSGVPLTEPSPAFLIITALGAAALMARSCRPVPCKVSRSRCTIARAARTGADAQH